jgi:hypothetical protein
MGCLFGLLYRLDKDNDSQNLTSKLSISLCPCLQPKYPSSGSHLPGFHLKKADTRLFKKDTTLEDLPVQYGFCQFRFTTG